MANELRCEIANLHVPHPRISAEDWRGPLILRLLRTTTYQDSEKTLVDSYRDLASKEHNGSLTLVWSGLRDEFQKRLNTYQASVLTEHATLGLACVLVSERASLEITEVTQRGERADYWLGNREMMLEVGGLDKGNLQSLREEKATQLLDNPYNMPGFVCVAVFAEHAACLWFYS